jgi:hypothetical protein
MKRKWTLAMTAAALVATFAFGPAASAGNQSLWYGHVSRNHPVLFTTSTIDGVLYVEPILMMYKMSCPGMGTVQAEAIFGGFELPVRHHRFAFNDKSPFGFFHWGGSLEGEKATGLLSNSFPIFDRHGNPMACASGDLAWNAHHVSTRPAGTVHPDVKIQFTLDQQGTVHVNIMH